MKLLKMGGTIILSMTAGFAFMIGAKLAEDIYDNYPVKETLVEKIKSVKEKVLGR